MLDILLPIESLSPIQAPKQQGFDDGDLVQHQSSPEHRFQRYIYPQLFQLQRLAAVVLLQAYTVGGSPKGQGIESELVNFRSEGFGAQCLL